MKHLGWKKEESGQSMVEFALILPILLLLIVGIMEFSWLFHQQTQVTAAAREGARTRVVMMAENVSKEKVDTAVANSLPSSVSDPTITIKYNEEEATVYVEVEASSLTGLFDVMDDLYTLSASATMRLEE
ncbi:TadE/TadG family type IV pilus assembly protein [Lacticigenium naphthae]|uniref:TadE/TadG family type IV pilus assembly protein n=1 Tax=Lacticigenium naphthae TaxID=515351 RepID=UPI00041DF5A6|nr:TadE family protein [Lacticigenium naphthae]